MSKGYMSEISQVIENAEEGSVFVISDFFDIAGSSTIRSILHRLVQEGKVRQVLKGVFEKPRRDEATGEYIDVDPDTVARTLARIFHWSIAPYGSAAVNLLGLSQGKEPVIENPSAEQNGKPVKNSRAVATQSVREIIKDEDSADCPYIYVSSGPYRIYDLGFTKLEFKHRTNRDILGFSYKTGLVTQALKGIGKDNITPEIINALSEKLSEDERKAMLQETKRSTGWVREAVWEIAGRRW